MGGQYCRNSGRIYDQTHAELDSDQQSWLSNDHPPVRGVIAGGEGLRGFHEGKFVRIIGPCGQKHVMSLAAGRALAVWLNQHCQPVRDAEFVMIEGDVA